MRLWRAAVQRMTGFRCGFKGSLQHFNLLERWVFMMKYRTRAFYTDKQKSEMWDRWQRGDSMSSIRRHFNRASSSIFPPLAQFGGIRPLVTHGRDVL